MTDYPEWQNQIRESYAKQSAINAEKNREQEERNRNENLKKGKNLQYALRLMGIETGDLTSNLYEVDGLRFYLWQYQGPDFDANKDENGNITSVRFQMNVVHTTPEDWDIRHDNLRQSIVIQWANVNEDWTWYQALLAEAIDDAYTAFAGAEARQETKSQPVAVDPKPTIEQQLTDIVRQIVRDEIYSQQGGF